MVSRYLTPDQDKLKAKGVKSVSSRVVNLSELGNVTVESMSEAMIAAFQEEYGQAQIGVANETDFPMYRELLPRYQSWEWNYGASPRGNMMLQHRFSWGGIEICAEVVGGVVENMQVYTDSMDETLSQRMSHALAGCPWRADALSEKARMADVDIADWLAQTV